MDDLFSLGNKTIIITGGAGHLGASMSEGLAKQGANVVIASRNLNQSKPLAQALNQKYSGEIIADYVDVSDEQSIQQLYKKLFDRFNTIDVLINNAHFSVAGSVERMTTNEWKFGIDGTLNSVFLCSKWILPHMVKYGRGNIINISSMYGTVSPDPAVYGDSDFGNPPNYGAGKAGVIQFTRYLACHYGRRGIRANSISPGPFPNKDTQQNKAFITRLNEKVPLGRIGKPEELQGAIIYLASDSSSYVTGHNLSVDGGWTSW
ncbi:SDR family oxidoreductase [Virgibacillus ihumii]|uniref:SDR family oxidoreductase n=1 Tax=Virgibacillus ihumii TaxID=2686091 RepID=UPI00157D4016|nr:SDR family oxidoreductase [Virgibacillus ihumii]